MNVTSSRKAQDKIERLIAYVCRDFSTPFFAQVMIGLEKEAALHGFRVLAVNTNGSEDLEALELDQLSEWDKLEGLIIGAVSVRENSGYEKLLDREKPFVFLDLTFRQSRGQPIVNIRLPDGVSFRLSKPGGDPRWIVPG